MKKGNEELGCKISSKTNYRQLWKKWGHKDDLYLIMTVVETPSLQLVKNSSNTSRSNCNKFISSKASVLPNFFPNCKTKRYTLDYFRSEPFSPFIPDLLLYGINEIENECHYTRDWSVYFICEKEGNKIISDKILRAYVSNPTTSESLKQCLDHCDIKNIGLCILNFFTIFEKKPLHFHSANLKKLLSEPLYDSFLRPNSRIKEIVQASVLKSSRTEVDTLAFIMIHILHIWEYTNLPLKTKENLARLFGPRLISFEDPVFLMKTEEITSPQAAMLEAILEICDSAFWENLNDTKRHEMFIIETNFERNRSQNSATLRDRPPEFAYMCSPYSLFPDVSNSLNKYDKEEYKKSNFYKKLIKVMR